MDPAKGLDGAARALRMGAASPAPPTSAPAPGLLDQLRAQDYLQTLFDFLGRRLLPAVLFFLVIWLIARLLRRLSDRWLRRRLETEVALLVSRAIYLGLMGLALFAAGTTLLVDANAAVWGVLGAALLAGLGLQDLFKNYISGVYILLERNIRVGDQVETNGFRGVVTDVKMRVTYLREDGRLIIVPNSELFNKVTAVAAPGGDPPAAGRPAAGSSGREGAQDDPGQ